MNNRTYLLYANPETNSDILYASGFIAPDPFVLISKNGEKYLILRDLEIGRAKTQSRVKKILSFSKIAESLGNNGNRVISIEDVAVSALMRLNIKNIEVPFNFPVGMADALRESGIELITKPDPFFPERIIKSRYEIDAIAEAQRKNEIAMEAAASALRNTVIKRSIPYYKDEKLTSERLREIINTELMRNNLIASHTIVSCGIQSINPHEEGHGPIYSDKPIIIDIYPRDMGSMYYGDMTRTFIIGKPSDQLKHQYSAVYEAQSAALEMIKDGVTFSSVHKKVNAVFAKHGFSTGEKNGKIQGFFHSTGHGIGLDLHEPPRIYSLPGIFKKGMIVSVEPGLYYPKTGGVRIEDLVVVEKYGIRNLNKFHKNYIP